jgi:hypothetical protein
VLLSMRFPLLMCVMRIWPAVTFINHKLSNLTYVQRIPLLNTHSNLWEAFASSHFQHVKFLMFKFLCFLRYLLKSTFNRFILYTLILQRTSDGVNIYLSNYKACRLLIVSILFVHPPSLNVRVPYIFQFFNYMFGKLISSAKFHLINC